MLAYRVLPSPIKAGVSNSLENISNLVTIPNNILQGDLAMAGVNTGRFLINSTVGLLGLIDVAQYMGLSEYVKEDYGQSLALAGVGPGCYIVLPVLGPSTARDALSSSINYLVVMLGTMSLLEMILNISVSQIIMPQKFLVVLISERKILTNKKFEKIH